MDKFYDIIDIDLISHALNTNSTNKMSDSINQHQQLQPSDLLKIMKALRGRPQTPDE